mmetsp:Transcript_89374/g.255977  ORF Transcript_89374/g.255977 Transcript_89374/m.255977 type:complete len:202 (+) Transcript_89374:307-912(+)
MPAHQPSHSVPSELRPMGTARESKKAPEARLQATAVGQGCSAVVKMPTRSPSSVTVSNFHSGSFGMLAGNCNSAIGCNPEPLFRSSTMGPPTLGAAKTMDNAASAGAQKWSGGRFAEYAFDVDITGRALSPFKPSPEHFHSAPLAATMAQQPPSSHSALTRASCSSTGHSKVCRRCCAPPSPAASSTYTRYPLEAMRWSGR